MVNTRYKDNAKFITNKSCDNSSGSWSNFNDPANNFTNLKYPKQIRYASQKMDATRKFCRK